jgi:hypothetical protein
MKALAHLAALAMLMLALTTVTFAKSNNKTEGNFTIPNTVRVGSTDLRPGDYKATWTKENGGAVKINILQHGKTVATVEGKLKDLQKPASFDAVILKTLDNNAKTIDEIDFNNRSQALVFGE